LKVFLSEPYRATKQSGQEWWRYQPESIGIISINKRVSPPQEPNFTLKLAKVEVVEISEIISVYVERMELMFQG
jgi:hypothetical protein